MASFRAHTDDTVPPSAASRFSSRWSHRAWRCSSSWSSRTWSAMHSTAGSSPSSVSSSCPGRRSPTHWCGARERTASTGSSGSSSPSHSSSTSVPGPRDAGAVPP